MIKSINAPKLTEILPQSIRDDKKIYAAAASIDEQIEKISALAKLVMHLPRLDELSGEVLDHLAYQFHCDFYLQDLPDSAKRDQIRESIFWHRIKGTPEGVEKALSTFMVGAQVQENWEYGGEDYFFRIITKGLKYLSTEEEFLRLIDTAKNVRSWLDGIIFDLTIEEPEIYHHAVAELESGMEENCVTLSDMSAQENLFHAVAELESGMEEIYFGGDEKTFAKYYFSVAELEGGAEVTESSYTLPPDDFWFEKWLLEKWREWELNPVVKQYEHPDDGGISPFDPDFFPTEGNFLRLFFRYPDNTYKFLTLFNPREDLSAADIKSVGILSRDLFRSPSGLNSVGLAKAFLVSKKTYKIF